MSIKAITYVLEHSQAEHSQRLVLLSLANHADDSGDDSFPSNATIARETRLGESTVRLAIERLKASGEIIEVGLGPKRTRRFRVVLDGADSAAPDPADSAVPQDLAPRSIERLTPQNLAPDPADSGPEPSRTVKEPSTTTSSPVGAKPAREDVASLCRLLADLILANDPKAKVSPGSTAWTDPCRLLLDRDGRTAAEIERVIRFCAADDFERANVLSMSKLRKRFTQLSMKANRAAPPTRSGAFDKYDQAAGLRRAA